MGTRYEAVLTSTHNLCFGAKVRIIRIPLQTPVLLYKKWGGNKGLYIARTCFPDVQVLSSYKDGVVRNRRMFDK